MPFRSRDRAHPVSPTNVDIVKKKCELKKTQLRTLGDSQHVMEDDCRSKRVKYGLRRPSSFVERRERKKVQS